MDKNPLLLFLQFAIGNRGTLDMVLSDEEWTMLLSECVNQAIIGIGFAGLERISEPNRPPREVLLKFFSYSERIRHQNERLSKECAEVCGFFRNSGFSACILKGQGNLTSYPDILKPYRMPGDIDVLVQLPEKRSAREIIRYCQEQSGDSALVGKSVCYHHVDMPWKKGINVEVHFRAAWFSSPLRNARFQRWYQEHLPFDGTVSVEGFPIPSNYFNSIFQLAHLFKHLMDEGIGLRQFLDYYFVLAAIHTDGTVVDDVRKQIHMMGLDRFASGVMYVLQTSFALPNEYLLVEPDEREGKLMMEDILRSGNFGHLYHPLNTGSRSHLSIKFRRLFMLLFRYPEEVLWNPWFMLFHWLWRKLRLWNFGV